MGFGWRLNLTKVAPFVNQICDLLKLADRQGPKGYGLRLHSTPVCRNHSDEARRKAPSYGHETMDTRNGVTSCGSSPVSPSEQATNRKPQAGGMPQEAKALGNARDRLTWGCYTRGRRSKRSPSFMANAKAYRKPDACPTPKARASSSVDE